MNQNEELQGLGLQVEELSDELKKISERQNTQFTEIMLLLKRVEDSVAALENKTGLVESRTEDELYDAAKECVIAAGKASASFLERKLGIGYTRAAYLIDELEDDGVIGPGQGATPRKVLVESAEENKNQKQLTEQQIKDVEESDRDWEALGFPPPIKDSFSFLTFKGGLGGDKDMDTEDPKKNEELK